MSMEIFCLSRARNPSETKEKNIRNIVALEILIVFHMSVFWMKFLGCPINSASRFQTYFLGEVHRVLCCIQDLSQHKNHAFAPSLMLLKIGRGASLLLSSSLPLIVLITCLWKFSAILYIFRLIVSLQQSTFVISFLPDWPTIILSMSKEQNKKVKINCTRMVWNFLHFSIIWRILKSFSVNSIFFVNFALNLKKLPDFPTMVDWVVRYTSRSLELSKIAHTAIVHQYLFLLM